MHFIGWYNWMRKRTIPRPYVYFHKNIAHIIGWKKGWEKKEYQDNMCIFSSNSAFIGWESWMIKWTISYSVQFQQIGRCIGRKSVGWENEQYYDSVCVVFIKYVFIGWTLWMRKPFFPPPLFGNISQVKQKATPCSMKVQLFHWWNFVHIHQWNCIHWKFMNDIFFNIHPWNLVDSSNGGKKNKIGMNYTWWMK